MNLKNISVAVALCLVSGVLQAHTKLKSSTPAEGSKLTASPASITLQFSEATQITALSIQKSEATEQSLGPLPRGPSEKVTVTVPKLAAGNYVVSWRAIGGDNHVMKGKLSFSVSAAQVKEHASAPQPR